MNNNRRLIYIIIGLLLAIFVVVALVFVRINTIQRANDERTKVESVKEKKDKKKKTSTKSDDAKSDAEPDEGFAFDVELVVENRDSIYISKDGKAYLDKLGEWLNKISHDSEYKYLSADEIQKDFDPEAEINYESEHEDFNAYDETEIDAVYYDSVKDSYQIYYHTVNRFDMFFDLGIPAIAEIKAADCEMGYVLTGAYISCTDQYLIDKVNEILMNVYNEAFEDVYVTILGARDVIWLSQIADWCEGENVNYTWRDFDNDGMVEVFVESDLLGGGAIIDCLFEDLFLMASGFDMNITEESKAIPTNYISFVYREGGFWIVYADVSHFGSRYFYYNKYSDWSVTEDFHIEERYDVDSDGNEIITGYYCNDKRISEEEFENYFEVKSSGKNETDDLQSNNHSITDIRLAGSDLDPVIEYKFDGELKSFNPDYKKNSATYEYAFEYYLETGDLDGDGLPEILVNQYFENNACDDACDSFVYKVDSEGNLCQILHLNVKEWNSKWFVSVGTAIKNGRLNFAGFYKENYEGHLDAASLMYDGKYWKMQ